MKKFYSLLVAAAIVLGATSCQKDATEEVVVNEPVSFTATLNATRTELGEGNKVMWNADDKIRIYTQDNLVGASFAGAAAEATATTTFTTTEEFAASETGYFAVYSDKTYFNENWSNDWSAKEASYNNGVWSVPVKMQGAQYEGLYLPAGKFVEENNFMVAYSEDNKLSFKAATAMIKFVHTGENTWGSFRASGADLAGAATLNYDTATGEISYTLEGTDTYIDFEVRQEGQTCYLPIYPGTVSGFELYDDQTLIAKYDGEFTFKPGVIYNMDIENMPALPETSPYSLLNMASYNQISMTVEDGYHIAKNVPFSETGYVVSQGWEMLYSVKTTDEAPVELNKWYTTSQYAEIEQNMTFESDYVDVYMTEDCANICFVPAGEAVPEMPGHTIYFYNADNWANVYFYSWDANDTHHTGAWPGTAMTKTMVGEVEYYAITLPYELNNTTLNFIFNNNAGTQTADLSATLTDDLYFLPNGKQVEDITNPVPTVSYKIYAYNYAKWSTLNFYAWGAYTNTWPGETLTETEVINGYTYYVKELPATATGGSLQMIFNNGNGTQTADSEAVTIDKDIYVRVNVGSVTFLDDPNNPEPEVVPTDYKIYVKNSAGWSQMYIYAWGGLSAGSWPGAKMTTEDINGTTYYAYEFVGAGAVSGASIIFNNGSGSQTSDITNVNLTEDLFYEVSGTGTNYKKIADPRL